MQIRIALTGLLLALSPAPSLRAQGLPSGVVGWYNGDWKPAIPGVGNWYATSQSFARVYDDFVVPSTGWIVTGAFAHSSMASTGVTQASWEIRAGVSVGNGGAVVASGVSPATQTAEAPVGNGTWVYLIAVTGLSVPLAPGTYWLSVAPVTTDQSTYLCATLGTNAVGNPPGNDGQAFLYAPAYGSFFTALQETGQGGTSGDFSLGALVTVPAVPPAGSSPVTTVTSWQNNLASLMQQMEALHSLPFPGISQTDFNANAAALSANIATLSDPQIRTGLQALVASVEDPHTDVEWPSSTPFRYLPLTFYWFDDGIYITAAPAQYQDLLGAKLVSVGQVSVEEATRRLTALVAHDNDYWAKYVIQSNKLTNTDFLFGTGITGTTDSVQLRVSKPAPLQHEAARIRPPSGVPVDIITADVQAMNRSQFPSMLQVFQGTLPLYRQHTDKYYWSTVIDGGATVYFQYNSCTEDPTLPSATFLTQLNQTLAGPGVERLIVDMRFNTGGFAFLDDWIAAVKTGRFNQPGRLYVITGRATFSAAMEATDIFHDQTNAIFVGEPTGGKPRFLLRRGDFGLPYFGIGVSYSNGVENATGQGPTQEPNIRTYLTFANYMNGADPALDAILRIPPPAGQ